MLIKPITFILLLLVAVANSLAEVSADAAGRLGKDLTPMGAERAGNADGSIPKWTPGEVEVPSDFVPGSDHYVDPYRDEATLYTIDINNWEEYRELLTDGVQGMMQKLGPEGFKINVYPSKRTHNAPDWYYANTAKNATQARLVDDGLKIEGSYPGVPFPIPQTGGEAIWNHMTRYQEPFSATYNTYYVGENGKPVLATTGEAYTVYPMYNTPDEPVGDKLFSKGRLNYVAPARRAGEILLIHEPGGDYTRGTGRKAWQYLKGQRRVRLAPAVAHDTPNPGVAGTSTYDDAIVYNGSPERFDWKLVGKREMIIPYSNYQFLFEKEVEDTLGARFIDPEVIRWEKHRVWVVEATRKEGVRHLYSKRRYYLDEDTWVAAAGETWDNQGQLWRVQLGYSAKLYDRKTAYYASYGGYDLIQGLYNINTKPIPGKYKNGVDKKDSYFTSKGMARGGVR